MRFTKFFSLDSPKAIKAQSFGYLNAINYMAPAQSGGVGNLCADASPTCLLLCLGWFSGQASMVSDLDNDTNSVRESRKAKTRMFMHARKQFMAEMRAGIEAAIRQAIRQSLKLCVRLNGASDVPWEAIKCEDGRTILETFPNVQFIDYTKSFKRAMKHAQGLMPANYHLTFSRSETNEDRCLEILKAGGNVAVVFGDQLPETWNGWRVIDGDEHDLRHLDPRGGVVIGLKPKGVRARRDMSGFVVRLAA